MTRRAQTSGQLRFMLHRSEVCESLVLLIQMPQNDTLMHLVSLLGHIDCLELLLKAGADVHMCCSGLNISPAAETGHRQCVRVLVSAKSDVHNALAKEGRTCLYIAADIVRVFYRSRCRMERSRYRLSQGSERYIYTGATPLTIALDSKNPSCEECAMLLKCAAAGKHT